MAYFEPRGYRWGGTKGILEDRIIANSQVITSGGFVNLVSGFVDGADAGERIWGLCVGIVTKNGSGLPLDRLTPGTDYHGTYVNGPLGTQKYTAASDNQTVDMICARIDVSPDLVVSNVPDADIGTTTGSNLAGNYTDIITDTQVDENNNTNAFTTVATLVILGVDPQNSTKGLYQVMERQDMGG